VATGLPSQEQVIELLGDEFARAGYEIEDVVVHASARPPRITVIADGDNPLDLDTIATLSRSASQLLDTLDADTGNTQDTGQYVLEVTSPGVDRPLTSEKHFRRARGRLAELALSDGSMLTGRLGGIDNATLRFVLPAHGGRPPTVREIPLRDVIKGVVQVEFSSPSPRELELATGETREGKDDGKEAVT
jgi:ribosome maturation factor RimP